MAAHHPTQRIAVVTGSRAEFGLLAPVMRAIRAHPGLELLTIAAGSHYLAPALTHREVEAAFPLAASVPMQDGAATEADSGVRAGRLRDAAATGRGIAAFASAFARLAPDWVLVLGDRIEAFAAAAAASIAGIPVAHIHGGDRAEGIADESMRHAITKLAHLHLAATPTSALRIIRMGERPETVHVVGSPAIDGLTDSPVMTDAESLALGDPRAVLLLHPSGLSDERESVLAAATASAVAGVFGPRVLWLAPNGDPGRGAVIESIRPVAQRFGWARSEHLPRPRFVSLLKRLSATRPGTHGVLVGNSSAGLIEAAALRVVTVNIGPRQNGRERAANVLELREDQLSTLDRTLRDAVASPPDPASSHPYGDGHAGERIAALLARPPAVGDDRFRKCCTY